MKRLKITAEGFIRFENDSVGGVYFKADKDQLVLELCVNHYFANKPTYFDKIIRKLPESGLRWEEFSGYRERRSITMIHHVPTRNVRIFWQGHHDLDDNDPKEFISGLLPEHKVETPDIEYRVDVVSSSVVVARHQS